MELNRTELEALRVLWVEAPLKPAEIQRRFSWTIDNGTLRSLLMSLMAKGHVDRARQGKAYFYRPVASRPRLRSAMARMMASVFAGGSTADLIAQMIQTEKLRPEEIAHLRRVAEEAMPADTGQGSETEED